MKSPRVGKKLHIPAFRLIHPPTGAVPLLLTRFSGCFRATCSYHRLTANQSRFYRNPGDSQGKIDETRVSPWLYPGSEHPDLRESCQSRQTNDHSIHIICQRLSNEDFGGVASIIQSVWLVLSVHVRHICHRGHRRASPSDIQAVARRIVRLAHIPSQLEGFKLIIPIKLCIRQTVSIIDRLLPSLPDAEVQPELAECRRKTAVYGRFLRHRRLHSGAYLCS